MFLKEEKWKFVIGFLTLLCANAWAAIPRFPNHHVAPVVRVLVEKAPKRLFLEGFDVYLTDVSTKHLRAHQDRNAYYQFDCPKEGKLRVFDRFRRLFESNAPLQVTSRGGFIRVGQKQFRENMIVYSKKNGCAIVNHLDLEKYVAGLLNSEMNASWNMNTLKAQAVAARTYALYQMQKGRHNRFDLVGTVDDQVYEGAHQERYRAIRAVKETEGLILTYHNKPIKAFYHSTCGGKTESPEQVWGARVPYAKAVKCGFCEESPRYQWSYSLPKLVFESSIRKEGLLKGDLLAMNVVERTKIGRAKTVELIGTKGVTHVKAIKIRDLFGTGFIRSTNFTTNMKRDFVTFQGRGSGHGVGMCQWGARAMGERGYLFQQILKHYYPNAKLTQLY
ncbi:MAG: SpoIID/LytB domain-containing protein [Bacteriovoracia bacterium]